MSSDHSGQEAILNSNLLKVCSMNSTALVQLYYLFSWLFKQYGVSHSLNKHVNIYYNIVNYLISGNAVSWYYFPANGQWSCAHPIRTLMYKHFGSVVGGSFMTGFFTIGDYMLDLISPRVT